MNRKWLVVLAVVVLITAAALAGVHLMQSATGNAQLLKSPLPERPRSTQSPSADASSTVEAPAATLSRQPSPASLPTTKASPSVNQPVAPSPRTKETVARAIGPEPEKNSPSATPRQPLAPGVAALSPPPPIPTETIRQRKSEEAVPKTAASDPNTDLFYKKALVYHRSGRLADAIRLYHQALKSDSSHTDTRLNLAAAYLQQGNFVDANALLKGLEQATPRPKGVLYNIAIAATGMGSPEAALAYLDSAEAAGDASPWEIRFQRAVAFARMNRLPEALVLYREAAAERPDAPHLQFNLAVTCDALGMYPEAIAYYEAVLQTKSAPSETDAETIVQRIRTIRRFLDTTPSSAKGQ